MDAEIDMRHNLRQRPPAVPRSTVAGIDALRAAMETLPRLGRGLWGPDLAVLAERIDFAPLTGIYAIEDSGTRFRVLSLQAEMCRRTPGFRVGCDYRDIAVPAVRDYAVGILRDVVGRCMENRFVATLPDARYASGVVEVAAITVPFALDGTLPTHIFTACSFSEGAVGAPLRVFVDDLVPLTGEGGRLGRPRRLSGFAPG